MVIVLLRPVHVRSLVPAIAIRAVDCCPRCDSPCDALIGVIITITVRTHVGRRKANTTSSAKPWYSYSYKARHGVKGPSSSWSLSIPWNALVGEIHGRMRLSSLQYGPGTNTAVWPDRTTMEITVPVIAIGAARSMNTLPSTVRSVFFPPYKDAKSGGARGTTRASTTTCARDRSLRRTRTTAPSATAHKAPTAFLPPS